MSKPTTLETPEIRELTERVAARSRELSRAIDDLSEEMAATAERAGWHEDAIRFLRNAFTPIQALIDQF